MNEKTFSPLPLHDLLPGLAEQPFERGDLEQTSYRPTIIIGIGGTGLEVIRRLKKLIRRYYQGDALEVFQFVVFDTAAQETPEGEEPLEAGEFVHLGAFDAADLIRHLDENPYVARWWPERTRPYHPTFSGTGANRVRAVGRLVMQTYLSSVIIPRIEAKIDRAVAINAQHGMGAASIKIYFICSLAGGTGSGMVIDLAYISRMLGLRRQPTTYLTGLLVLDDAFLPKAHTEYTRAEFRANTYQALREINYFSSVRRFKEVYDDITSTEELPDGFKPFDMTYLLGLHNAEGQAIESFESLADMIAAEVMTEIASPLRGRTENVLDNVRANERSIAGQPATFSSFALSALVFPLQGVASWCALAALETFLREGLLAPRAAGSEVAAEVQAFLLRTGVEQTQANLLLDRLGRDARGEPGALPTLSHDQALGMPDEQVLGALQRSEESALGELTLLKRQQASNVDRLQSAFARDLRACCEVVLQDPQRGPQYLGWFLEGLETRLKAQREQLIGEQAYYHAETGTHENAWRAAVRGVERILRVPAFLPGRGALLTQARAAHTTAFNAYLNALVQVESRSQAARCTSAFIDLAAQARQALTGQVSSWLRLAESCTARAHTPAAQERATETEYSLMRNVIDTQALELLFARYRPQLQDETARTALLSAFWQAAPAGVVLDGAPQALLQPYTFLADWFARQMAGRTLLDLLRQRYGEGWRREIELRYRQTSPFWNYTEARYGDKIRNNLQHEPRLVGYGEDDIAAWSGLVARSTGEPVDGVNNKNPHEMVFLNTSHGLPLFALRAVNQTMHAAHQYLSQLWRRAAPGSSPIPLHVSSLWESDMIGSDIQPRPESPSPAREPLVITVTARRDNGRGAAADDAPGEGQE